MLGKFLSFLLGLVIGVAAKDWILTTAQKVFG